MFEALFSSVDSGIADGFAVMVTSSEVFAWFVLFSNYFWEKFKFVRLIGSFVVVLYVAVNCVACSSTQCI